MTNIYWFINSFVIYLSVEIISIEVSCPDPKQHYVHRIWMAKAQIMPICINSYEQCGWPVSWYIVNDKIRLELLHLDKEESKKRLLVDGPQPDKIFLIVDLSAFSVCWPQILKLNTANPGSKYLHCLYTINIDPTNAIAMDPICSYIDGSHNRVNINNLEQLPKHHFICRLLLTNYFDEDGICLATIN